MQAEVNIKASFKAAQDKNLVKDAQAQGKKAGQAFGKQAGKGISNELQKNKGIINSLKDLLSGKGLNVSSIAGLLKSPILATIAAGTAVLNFIKKAHEKANLQRQENYSNRIQDIKESMQEREKGYSGQDQAIKALKEMANAQHLSNAEKMVALNLIKKLNASYQNLGVTLNTLTGEIQGLNNVDEKVEIQRLKKQQADLRELIKNSKSLQYEQLQGMMGNIWGHTRNQNILLKGQKGLEENLRMGTAENILENLVSALARIPYAGTSVMNYTQFFTGKKANQRIFYGNNAYTSAGGKTAFANLSVQQQLKRAKLLRQNFDKSWFWGDQGEKKKLDDYIKSLKQQLQFEKKIAEVKEKRLNFQIQINAQQQAQARKAKQAQWGKQQGYQKGIKDIKRNQQYNALTSNEDRIAFLQKQQQALANKRGFYEYANNEIGKKRYADSLDYSNNKIRENDITRQIQGLTGKGNLTEAQAKRLRDLQGQLKRLQAIVYPFAKQRRQDQVQMAKNETQIKRIMLEQAKIQERINALKKIEKDYVDSTLKSLDTSVMKYELQGDYQKATQEQIRRNAQAKGIKNLDPENLKKLMDATDTFRKYTLQQAMKGNFQSTYDNLTAGKRTAYQEFQYQKRQYEERYKTQLTGKQETALLDKINAEFGMKDNQKYLEYLKKGMGQIKTNELTARGGFAGGAYIPQTADYAKQIATYNQQQNSYLQQIKQAVISLGTIN